MDLYEEKMRDPQATLAAVACFNKALHRLLGFVIVAFSEGRKAANARGVPDMPFGEEEEEEEEVVDPSVLQWDERKTTKDDGWIRVNASDLFDGGTVHKKRDQHSGLSGVKLQVGIVEDDTVKRWHNKELIICVIFDRQKISDEEAAKWWEANFMRFPVIRVVEPGAPDEEKWVRTKGGDFKRASEVAVDDSVAKVGDEDMVWDATDEGLLAQLKEAGNDVVPGILDGIMESATGSGQTLIQRLLTCTLILLGHELDNESSMEVIKNKLAELNEAEDKFVTSDTAALQEKMVSFAAEKVRVRAWLWWA